MYLTKIKLENFLSYKEPVELEIDNKAIIVGANGSGKSNLLRILI